MPEPLEQLRAELQAAGMPGDETDRLLEELQDHLQDLVEEAASAGISEGRQLDDARSRLGHDSDLVAVTLAAYPSAGASIQGDSLLITDSAPRWAVAIVGSATFTLLLLFILQLALIAR